MRYLSDTRYSGKNTILIDSTNGIAHFFTMEKRSPSISEEPDCKNQITQSHLFRDVPIYYLLHSGKTLACRTCAHGLDRVQHSLASSDSTWPGRFHPGFAQEIYHRPKLLLTDRSIKVIHNLASRWRLRMLLLRCFATLPFMQ